MVLKDIWGLSDRAVERVALWMADALVAAAIHETRESRTDAPVRKERKKAP
jgi:hypothetical protein